MDSPLIWIIDNNHWERAGIGALLIEGGYRVEGFSTIRGAMVSLYRGFTEKPKLIVIDLVNLVFQPEELEEVARVGIPAVLLTGVYKPDGETVKSITDWAAVLRRPFTMGQVAEAVDTLARGIP